MTLEVISSHRSWYHFLLAALAVDVLVAFSDCASFFSFSQQGKPVFASEMQLHRQLQNPPQHHHGAGSTSTPDLTQHKQNVSASSPDLHLGSNHPPRPHRPLPPVTSFAEDNYDNEQVSDRERVIPQFISRAALFQNLSSKPSWVTKVEKKLVRF